jgi:hypothetical protein
MVASRREDRAALGQMRQRLEAYEKSQTNQPGSQQVYTPEELQAISAIKRLMAGDPELKAMLDLGKKGPQFEQRFQSLDQIEARAAHVHQTAAVSSIKELAGAAGFPVDDNNLRHIVRLVAGEAMSLENGNERYAKGDPSLFQEAFRNITPWLSALRKPAEQSVTATKNKMKQLPPPMRGSVAGQPAAKPIKEGEERQAEQDMHKRARERLSQLLEG